MTYRYEALASELEDAITKGTYPIGTRLPSIRETCRRQNVSTATVMEAYARLEERGLIEPRPRSGFYVKRPVEVDRIVPPSRPKQSPEEVSVSRLAMEILEEIGKPEMVHFGASVPSADLFPIAELARSTSRAARIHADKLARYEAQRGSVSLREAVVQIMAQAGRPESSDGILISNGAQEALTLALRATTRANDVVAVESPVYWGLFQALEAQGLRALELPTHPQKGVDIDALEAAARRGEIQACILTPTHQNPLGFCMSDSDKQAAVETLARYEIPLIEDDVFGALGLEYPRPRPAKAYDTAGNVIYCGSFSKVLSPAFRLGWLAPGRYAEEVLWQKILLNISSPTILQLAMVDYLKGNRFRRVTQLAARHYAQRIHTLRDAVLEHFPAGTTCSAPVGGYYLWVEMPGDYDSATLYRHALSNGITLTPGRLFTSAGGYRSCLRMSVAAVTAKVIPEAVAKLGRLAVFCRR